MHELGNILLIVVGVLAIIVVADAAIRTFVVPRGTVVFFTSIVFRSIRRIFTMVGSARRG